MSQFIIIWLDSLYCGIIQVQCLLAQLLYYQIGNQMRGVKFQFIDEVFTAFRYASQDMDSDVLADNLEKATKDLLSIQSSQPFIQKVIKRIQKNPCCKSISSLMSWFFISIIEFSQGKVSNDELKMYIKQSFSPSFIELCHQQKASKFLKGLHLYVLSQAYGMQDTKQREAKGPILSTLPKKQKNQSSQMNEKSSLEEKDYIRSIQDKYAALFQVNQKQKEEIIQLRQQLDSQKKRSILILELFTDFMSKYLQIYSPKSNDQN